MLELNRQRRPSPESSPAAQGGAPAVDEAIGREAREQRFGSKLDRSRNLERPQQEKGALDGAGKDAAAGVAKMAGPAGQVGGAMLGAQGKKGGMMKKIQETSKQFMGGFIKSMWSSLWPTFGHTIFIIDILFLVQAGSKYMRKYLPAIGEEWIPGELLKKLQKSALIPLKLGEILAMIFITFFTFMLDMILVSILAVVYAAIDSVAKHF